MQQGELLQATMTVLDINGLQVHQEDDALVITQIGALSL